MPILNNKKENPSSFCFLYPAPLLVTQVITQWWSSHSIYISDCCYHHELGGLNHTILLPYSSESQKSAKTKVLAGLGSFLKIVGKNLCPRSLELEDTHIS